MRIGPLSGFGVLLVPLAIGGTQPVDAAPEGQITWASQVTIVPGWFDPGEASVGSASRCCTRFTTRSCSSNFDFLKERGDSVTRHPYLPDQRREVDPARREGPGTVLVPLGDEPTGHQLPESLLSRARILAESRVPVLDHGVQLLGELL